MNPLISIALCTFNGSQFIERQVTSILNQTYKNIEIIIVDDCSTDNTFEILQNLCSKYPQIKSFRNTENIGFNKNFEKAIQLTTGDYIAISDQDDIWLESKLQRLIENIKNKWLIFSNSEWIDEQEKLLEKQILAPNFSLGNRTYKSFLFYNVVTGHTSLFTRELLKYIFPIPESGFYDWWIGFVAIYHNQIICLNECLTLHRIHSSSVMSRFKGFGDANIKQGRFKEINIQLSLLKQYKYLKKEDKRLISMIHDNYSNNGYNLYLIKVLFQHYNDFFPDLKKRKGLSKLNYAIKFTKRV